MPRVTLLGDSKPFEKTSAQLFAEFGRRTLDAGKVRIEAAKVLADPVRLESKCFVTPRASGTTVVFHASERLLHFLAAVRAGEFDA